MLIRSVLSGTLPIAALLCSVQAQTSVPTGTEVGETVDVIVQVEAYDWADNWFHDGFGHQFNTLIARVETVKSGDVFDPWIRVDFWGYNYHRKDGRLPDELFEPGHHWEMLLTPTFISEKNYQFCRPQETATIKYVDESGQILSEENALRRVSVDLEDIPDISELKCYALTRENVREVDPK